MFHIWQQEIQYIGKFSMNLWPLWYYKHEIYPISTIDSKNVNKDIILKWFDQEIITCRESHPNWKNLSINFKDTVENLKYERVINEWFWTKQIWKISFEIYEETRLREKRDFLNTII